MPNTSGNQRFYAVKPSHTTTAFAQCALGQIFVNNPMKRLETNESLKFRVPTQLDSNILPEGCFLFQMGQYKPNFKLSGSTKHRFTDLIKLAEKLVSLLLPVTVVPDDARPFP